MTGIFHFDTPVLVSFSSLFIMSCLSLIFFLSFRLKSRSIGKLPKKLPVSIFNKTFNVFDPYPDHRKIIHSFITLLPIFVVVGGLIFALGVMKILEAGLILGLLIFIVCVGLMMIDEALEIYRNANIFLKAIENGVRLGKGDLTVIFLLKEILPRLSLYYLFLSIVFFSSSIMLPYIAPAVLFIFAQFVQGMFSASVGFRAPLSPLLSFYFIALMFTIITVIVQLVAKKVKSKVFGLPPSEEITVLFKMMPRAVPADI